MRIITEGARQLLIDRIQCMRDVNGEIDDAIQDLMQRRADCCGYDLSISEPQPGETFYILTENDLREINEDGVYPIQEAAP
jgi:hypothetical protein